MVQVNAIGLFALVARLVLAWVFIRAGLPKVQDPVAFAASIDNYRIVEGSLSLWVALVLPWLEVVIGIGLLTPWLRQASGWAITALLGLFIGLHTSAWARGLDIDCGCFGESNETIGYHWLILRNSLLLLVAIFILLRDSRNKKTPESSI
ncbi:MAG: MauE/DoxX family redox-associated membrane protein [Verrucomicrobiota bacterium]